jgi:NaMN:DMB phosphoribosyltransferase
MGGKPAPSPQVQYVPAPPAPGPPTQVPTQAVTTQTALDQTSSAQQQLNALLGSALDRTNYEFNTTQDIRKTQATAAENRLGYQTQAEEGRATNLQGEMFRRYQNNFDYSRAQNAYHA